MNMCEHCLEKAMVVVHATDFFLVCSQMDGYLLDLSGEATASEPFIRLIGGDLAMAARLVKTWLQSELICALSTYF